MQDYTQHVGGRYPKQHEIRPGQVPNSSGAAVFAINCWARLDRFLILGSAEPTYYASARKLTKENAAAIEECIKTDAFRTVTRIAEVSHAGRAPNNDPALFALACVAALGDQKARLAAMGALTSVARTGTHLFHFLQYATDLGQGWGRCFKGGVAHWFDEKSVDDLAYQALKYKSRDGWAMRDVLRLAHPNPEKVETEGSILQRKALYRWIAGHEDVKGLPRIIEGSLQLATETNTHKASLMIGEWGLPREAVPTQFLNSAEVWEALLYAGGGMPATALVRNLAKMTQVGLLQPMGDHTAEVIKRLGDADAIKKSRLHPIAFLKALMTYKEGHGDKGKLEWKPIPKLCDALDAAFYLAFGNVEPTGKKIFLALDVSGSMSGPRMQSLGCTPREAACAMAMVTNRVEPNAELFAFSSGMIDINISPRCRLDEFVKSTEQLPFDSTDCSLPMRIALANKMDVDAFVIYTDSETNAMTQIQPSAALKQYRRRHGDDCLEAKDKAKLAVVAMTSNGFSIANPAMSGMLDVVGMDTAVPQVLSDFIKEGV